MKYLLTFLLVFFGVWCTTAQTDYEPFQVELEAWEVPAAPGVQSYAWASHDGLWLICGGQVAGLHDHRPPFSFLPETRNTNLFVIDPEAQLVWTASTASLPPAVREQLAASNPEFYQLEDQLFYVGGYGYDAVSDDWITHPALLVLDVPALIDAIQNQQPLSDHIRRLEDPKLAVTGGYLGYIDGQFYLAGGQNFEGRYNPHNGPSFVQEYTDEIRIFEIADDGSQLTLTNYQAWHDEAELHRRDYNMLPQIFPDGDYGYTIFSGVFRPDVDLPWLNTVDFQPDGYQVIADFEQLLNQYHTAHLPIYDSQYNAMHSLFFGGIGMYYPGPDLVLLQDSLVPFVKTISRVTRLADGAMSENLLEMEMPGYFGASAEFIPHPEAPLAGEGILDLSSLPQEKTLIGYIYGGIESTQSNIFMQFSGSSEATGKIFKVYITRGVSQTNYRLENPAAELIRSLYPNPASNRLTVGFELKQSVATFWEIIDSTGEIVYKIQDPIRSAGLYEVGLNLPKLAPGLYFLRLEAGGQSDVRRFGVE